MLQSQVALLALVAQVMAIEPSPIAVRKLSLDSGEKILAEHLAFAPIDLLIPGLNATPARIFADAQDANDQDRNLTIGRYRPAFAPHYHNLRPSLLQRAAETLMILERRSSCPSGMNSCASIGAPYKCCQDGTYCTEVDDSTVGHIACCPSGSNCGGAVRSCPTDAVSCPADLGGGCCIPGYVCQGEGCVPSASAKPTTAKTTQVQTRTQTTHIETVTMTRTTIIEGNPSTVMVTLTITKTVDQSPTTRTTTRFVTATNTGSATGGAPYRPISSSNDAASETTSGDTQTGCPVGFYGCLATHGGGCCRTDRDCQTYSCPSQASTRIVNNGITVVVPATDVPSQTTATCASGWFLCGKAAGPVAGCCPSGYDCGTASCFTSGPTQTGSVQKQLAGHGLAPKNVSIKFGDVRSLLLGLTVFFLVN